MRRFRDDIDRPTGHAPRRARIFAMPALVLPSLFFLALLAISVPATAQVQEWLLVDRGLQTRATAALKRYFTIVAPDSTRLRYITRNAAYTSYRLRGVRTENDSLGWLLSISLGQLTLPTVSSLRIAFGDDLYTALLLSRNDPLSERRTIFSGDPFGYNEWDREEQLLFSLNRNVYRIRPELGGFVAFGAPESNQYWWSDGTMRVGITSPSWEFGVVLPFGSGGTAVGPLRARLLAPGTGASAMVRLADVIARARFTAITDAALASPKAGPDYFVHTLSSQIEYTRTFETAIGEFYLDGGVGYEEFTKIVRDLETGSTLVNGRVRRLSPIGDIIWTSVYRNFDLGVGFADFALRGSMAARLTEHLSVELRWVSNHLFRPAKSFEHPFLLFVTPQIRF